MARILLVYPPMKTLAARFPYSLLPIAGVLIEAGHEVRLLDGQVEDIESVDPRVFDIVGISSYSGPPIEGALKTAAHIREKAPDKLIVWGGVHATITAHQTASHPLVDIVVRGEGEKSFLNLVEAVERGKEPTSVSGLTLIKDGEIIDTGDTPFLELDELPFLPYRLIKPERYVHFSEKPSRVYFESSRGCPHNCGFCYNEIVHKRKWRAKSVERVLDELEYIMEELGPDEIWPSDDNFGASKKRMAAIARGKMERGLDFKWVISSRFDYAMDYDDELLKLMKETGCDWMSFGGESGSQKVLDTICKGITPEFMRLTTRRLKENDIVCGVNFMAGFPDETESELNATFDLIDELAGIDKKLQPGISIYTPFPGTPLYPTVTANGFREPGSLEEWSRYRYGAVENLPWLNRRRRNILRTVGLLTSFDFTAGEYRERGVLSGRRLFSAAYRLFNSSARFRWKRRFFRLAPEWHLLDVILRILKYWER
ncbi:MAG: B12-binding domain-containing radical SAM protein [Actinobacteria bacterium]|nr:B12-binding domain-containing radical SAM protein [Actinomycetota bacterium]